MKKLEVTRKKILSEDLKTLKKKEPFTKMTDKEFLQWVYATAFVIGISLFGLLFKMEYLAFSTPIWYITAPSVFLAKEFVKLKKRVKAEKKVENIVDALNQNDIKINANDLVNSTIRHKETIDNDLYTNCYLFLDKNNKINGLYEEVNSQNKEINYYTLNNYELNRCYDYTPKKKVLTKETIKWR